MASQERTPAAGDALAAIEERLAAANVEFVRFEQTDLHGISRSKTVPLRHLRHFGERGLNFLLGQLGFDVQAGVASGTGYLESLGFPDSRIFPDPETVQVLPWADATARVLCEPYFLDGRPAMAAPRLVVKQLLRELDSMGYRLLSGFEYEFYVVDEATREPPFRGIQIFATLRNTFDEPFIYDLLRGMSAVGVDIITANAEYGPGQLEINFAPAIGVAAADQAFTFKNGVKEIARRHGYLASFMTKPYADQSACGCHYHHSLLDRATGRNAFSDPDRPFDLNDTARWWLGGQLAHAAAVCALVAPTINCYKRYKLWSFAPTNATWGVENRTTAVRVKGLAGEGAHLENRTPCGAANPYLVLAAVLAAGIDGLKNRTEPPPETPGVAYGLAGVADLPRRLEHALTALEEDRALRAALGEEFIGVYTAVKRHEIAKAAAHCTGFTEPDFNDRVDEWEREEFFEFL